jgi:hypothetical protein
MEKKMTGAELEKICFLYYKDGNLCEKKCGGHNKDCGLYTHYDPAKKMESRKEYMNYPSRGRNEKN